MILLDDVVHVLRSPGIEKKGIGPVYAKKLIARFGEELFEVIEKTPNSLEQVEGIGPKRKNRITNAWRDQRAIRDIMLFLHSHGVGTSRAVRIYKTYGAESIERVRANPYILAKDIRGIGFKTADAVAQKLGIPLDSAHRVHAGVEHTLHEATQDGHCALPSPELLSQTAQLLELGSAPVEQALSWMLTKGDLVLERAGNDDLIFLPHLVRAEREIAQRMGSSPSSLLVTPRSISTGLSPSVKGGLESSWLQPARRLDPVRYEPGHDHHRGPGCR